MSILNNVHKYSIYHPALVLTTRQNYLIESNKVNSGVWTIYLNCGSGHMEGYRSDLLAGALMWSVHSVPWLCVWVHVCVNRTVVVVSQSFPFRNPKAATGGRGLDSVRWLVRITACTQLSGTKPERRQREGRTVLLQHNTRFHLPPKGTVFMWQAETRPLGATPYPPPSSCEEWTQTLVPAEPTSPSPPCT